MYRSVKRIIDPAAALFLLLLLSPFLLLLACITLLTSKGSIIYKQERIGYNGIPFMIYKFRSMYVNAELNGPSLSYEKDPRITSWGRIMRKWKLDELPQLWNILKGDMSFVGPRPERKFYIDQLTKNTAYYRLLTMRPGLSSWGMVQFGYASSVEAMKERMQYDLLYVEKASFFFDAKVLWYTLLIILSGKSK
ncbi:MAG: sugar transferase [Bacteroidota bacterium]|nr:sugar transferase [Bacteroidota bacterium]